MKALYKIIKVLSVIAAIVGVVYLVAAYGDRIVAWARRTLDSLFNKRTCFFDIDEQLEDEADFEEEEVAEEEAELACEA